MTLYTIKPLEWVRAPSDYECWQAKTLIGRLSVHINWQGSPFRWLHEGIYAYTTSSPCDSIEDGKAKAEAYYREQLAGALEAVPDGAQLVGVHYDPAPDHDRPPGGRRP